LDPARSARVVGRQHARRTESVPGRFGFGQRRETVDFQLSYLVDSAARPHAWAGCGRSAWCPLDDARVDAFCGCDVDDLVDGFD